MTKAWLAAALLTCIALAAPLRGGPPPDYAIPPPRPQGPAFDVSQFSDAQFPATTAVTVRHIEVTQGIQDIDHSVAILAGRRTFARVYFDVTTPGGWGQVNGQLTVVAPDGTSTTVNPYASISVMSQWNGDDNLELKRSWDGMGLLFELPAASVAVGQLTVNLTNPTDMYSAAAAIPCANCAAVTRSVAVTAGAPLRLTVVGLQYSVGNTSHAPTALDFGLTQSWLMRSYPVTGITYNSRTVPATAAWPFECDDANAQVAAIRAADVNAGTDHRTHYYAMVANGGGFMRGCAAAIPAAPTPSAVASGPTGPTGAGLYLWDTDGSWGDWYAGHELGHTLGRMHVGGQVQGCGALVPDPNYPFANAQIADGQHPFVGYDIGDPNYPLVVRRAEPGRVSPYPATPVTIWHDIMSYCASEWLSSYTYEAIGTRLVAEDALAPPAEAVAASEAGLTAGRLMHVVGRLEEGWRAGRIDALTRVGRAASNPPAPADAPELVLLDGAGREMSRTPVAVFRFEDVPSAGDTAHPAGLINAAIPIDAAARTVRIEYGGRVLATRTGGTGVPHVSVGRSPARRGAEPQALRGAQLIRWSGSHPQRSALTYTVLLSGDGGATWETHAVGLPQAQYRVPPETAARLGSSGRPLRYRIVASDGFNSSETSGTLD